MPRDKVSPGLPLGLLEVNCSPTLGSEQRYVEGLEVTSGSRGEQGREGWMHGWCACERVEMDGCVVSQWMRGSFTHGLADDKCMSGWVFGCTVIHLVHHTAQPPMTQVVEHDLTFLRNN